MRTTVLKRCGVGLLMAVVGLLMFLGRPSFSKSCDALAVRSSSIDFCNPPIGPLVGIDQVTINVITWPDGRIVQIQVYPEPEGGPAGFVWANSQWSVHPFH